MKRDVSKATLILVYLLLVSLARAQEKEEVAIEDELNENSIIALNEDASAALETSDISPVENTEYAYHLPQVENSLEPEDLMMAGQPSVSITADHKITADHNENQEEDIMSERTKREVYPSFSDISNFISNKGQSIANEKEDILTAFATENDNDDGDGDDKHSTLHNSKRGKRNANNARSDMKSIFSELKSSKHHKLTRSDIRQLAKKAVMLATLKKLGENKTNPMKKSSTNIKPTEKSSKKHKIKKHSKKGRKKHHTGSQIKKSDTTTTPTAVESVVSKSENPVKSSEMSEDLSHTKKKSSMELLSDDAMSKSDKSSLDADSDDMKSNFPTSSIVKKSSIAQIDKTVENIFDEGESLADPKPTENIKKSLLPNTELSDKMTSLKSFLERVVPGKIPSKFLPDLPSGLRMIGWKELVDKKKKQLSELESAVGATETITESTAEVKPVTVNIDVDQDNIEKETAKTQSDSNDFDITADKKHDIDSVSIQHVGYLQRHIKTARSLRKLIAKTLVGHCKSTGKRILDAFVAMDKALARAQTIAAVIGKKFNIDIDRIDALVGDKEDQVVETFLKDIFTKI